MDQLSSQVKLLKPALIGRAFACATLCKANQSHLVSAVESHLTIVCNKRQTLSALEWTTIAICPNRINLSFQSRYLWVQSGPSSPTSPMSQQWKSASTRNVTPINYSIVKASIPSPATLRATEAFITTHRTMARSSGTTTRATCFPSNVTSFQWKIKSSA